VRQTLGHNEVHDGLSTQSPSDHDEEPRYEGEAVLLRGRITDLERDRAEREKEEKKYRDVQLELNQGQLKTNRRIALFTLLLVVCTAVTGGISWRQANITKQAAVAAEKAAIAAQSNADTAASFLEQSKQSSDFTLHQMASQTAQQQIAATAAKESAQTAKLALHVSERAYLVRGDVSVDLDRKVITINIVNAGHLPTGLGHFTAHEAVVSPSLTTEGMVHIREARTIESDVPSIAPGIPQIIKFTSDFFDPVLFTTGRQNIIIVGLLTYNDGFQDESDQTLKFCAINQYHPQIGRTDFGGCNVDETLSKIKKWESDPNVSH
jgi:hypothetical protein